MLGEVAVCLACDAVEVPGGLWTPAAALGPVLRPRLERRAEVSFSIEDSG